MERTCRMWYLAGLIPLYILSPIIILWPNVDENEIKRYLFIVILLSLIGLCDYRGVLENILFCIGLIIAKLIIRSGYTQLNLTIKKRKIIIITVCYVLFTRISARFELENSWFWIMAIVLSYVLCFIVGRKIRLLNKVLLFFCNISLESYLCNYFCVFIFNTYTLHLGGITIKPKTHLCYLFIICFGIMSAFVLNKFDCWLIGVIVRLRQEKTLKKKSHLY